MSVREYGKSRCYMLRMSNPTAWLDVSEWTNIKFAVWQLEIGDEGTVHYQMYANFSKPMSYAGIHACEGARGCHIESRQGSKEECVTYCSKEETRLEGPYWYPDEASVRKHASGGQAGRRTDLDQLYELVKSGATDSQIADVNPGWIVKFQKGIDHLRLAMAPTGRNAPSVDSIVYVGPSGTGKSYRLRQECPEGVEWFWVSPGKWFDGYQGQSGLVFDEFRDNWMPYNYLLKLIDTFPMRVEKKGGVINMRAVHFRFSTNVHPKAWYSGRVGKEPWASDPLRRRLNRIELMSVPFVQELELYDDADAWWDGLHRLQPDAAGVLWEGLFGEGV